MAINNTSSDAANTAVRALLTKIAEHHQVKLSLTSKKGKSDWDQIKKKFGNCCAYCGISETKVKLQVEHIIMLNKEQVGIHHLGNIIPCCASCNSRRKGKNKKPLNWGGQLDLICNEKREKKGIVAKRKQTISTHIKKSSKVRIDKKRLKGITENLYTQIQELISNAYNDYSKSR